MAVRAKKIFLLSFLIAAFSLVAVLALAVAFYNPQKPVKIKARDFNTSVEKNEVKKLLQNAFAISARSAQVLGAETPLEAKKEGSVKKADFSFNAIAPSWQADIPAGSQVQMQIRTSQDGANWSSWRDVEADEDDGNDKVVSNKIYGRLIVAQGKYFQERLIFKTEDVNLVPAVRNFKLTYIDSKEKRNLLEKLLKRIKLKAKEAAASYLSTDPTDPPSICTRACWGADESIYVPGEEYSPIKKMIVHHTVTSNNDPDPAATVRAIYYFHNVGRGWGDIGYNFLIDQNNGTIYEGRYGGDSVVGAHASGYNRGSVGVAVLGDFRYVSPNKRVQNALHKIAVWKLYSHGIDPDEVSFFGNPGANLPTIFVHGKVANTACAGTHLNNFVPNLIAWAHYMPQQILLTNSNGVQRIEGSIDQTTNDLLAAYAGSGTVSPVYVRKATSFSNWRFWEQLGNGVNFLDNPAVTSWAPRRLDVFVRGVGQNLSHGWWDGSRWYFWENLGGNFTFPGSPTGVSWGPNRIDVFVRGSDNALYHGWWDGSRWYFWENLGGNFEGDPVVASWAPNRLDVFGRSMSQTLSHAWWDGSRWYIGEELGNSATFPSNPAAVSWGNNRIDIFVRGSGQTLSHGWWSQ